jgi:large subunit ribosomal protein L5
MVVPAMMKQFNYTNVMEVPLINHISINMGIGDAKENPKKLESGIAELTLISGQKPVVTRSRKDISNFKIRKGFPIGCKVTIRGNRMYDFLERLVSVALPRTRDFRGLSFKSFDGRGNYTLGVKEHIIFPEIDFDKIDKIKGLDICITTSAKNNEEAMELFKQFNFPFK